jgi:hypothetical protein
MRGFHLFIAWAAWAASSAAGAVAAQRVQLASKGQALQTVRVADGASQRTRAAAETLAALLTKISEAKFEVAPGPAKAGIVVGVASDFPGLPWAKPWADPKPQERERYVLRSHARGR